MGLANGNLFPEFGELGLWGPALPLGDMHQSVTDALVFFINYYLLLLVACFLFFLLIFLLLLFFLSE